MTKLLAFTKPAFAKLWVAAPKSSVAYYYTGTGID